MGRGFSKPDTGEAGVNVLGQVRGPRLGEALPSY